MADIVINAAILHIFDYAAGNTVISESTMNLEDPVIEKYLKRILNHCISDIRIQHGFFEEDSIFLQEVQKYYNMEVNFVKFSDGVLQTFIADLQKLSSKSYDILFVSWSQDGVPYVGMFFLENQQAYTHYTTTNQTAVVNQVILQSSLMPSPTRKVNTFAVVNMMQMEAGFVDATNWNDTPVNVMQDMILHCTCEKSTKEIMNDVEQIVDSVAIACDENPTLLMSKYKNYVQNVLEDVPVFTTEDLAVHVFNESDEMQNTFLSAAMEYELPKQIQLPQKTSTKMKQQKIKTDTGIELSFPTEYFENPKYIQFTDNPDGTISIQIRNIGKIINK